MQTAETRCQAGRSRAALLPVLLCLALLACLAAPAAADEAGDLTKAGQVAFKQGRYDIAEQTLEKAVAADATSGAAFYWLGETYLAVGRARDARWAFANAIAKGAADADAHRGLADALLLVGAIDSAGTEYDAALAQKPKMEGALLGKGRVLFEQKKYDEALAAFDAGLKKARRKAPFHAWRGLSLAAQGAQAREDINTAAARADTVAAKAAVDVMNEKFKEADVTIRTASDKLEPTDPEWKILLGDMYLMKGSAASAVEAYAKANALTQNRNALYLFKLGRARAKDRNYTDAVEAYRHATEVDSTMAPAWRAMGELYYLSGDRMDAAAVALQHYVALESTDASAWLMLGDALFRGHHYPEAIEPLKKTLEMAPDSCRAGLILGNTYALYGNTGYFDAEGNIKPWQPAQRDSLYGLARAAYVTAIDRCPGEASAEVYVAAGKLSLRQKDYAKAVEFLQKGMAADTTSAELAFQLGLAHFYQLKYDAAIPLFQRAVALDDSNALAYLNLGLSYYGKGRYAEAIDALARADSLLPQDNVQQRSQALMWKGLAQAQLKDYAAAAATLTRAVEVDPQNPTVAKNLQLVRNLAHAPAPGGGTTGRKK